MIKCSRCKNDMPKLRLTTYGYDFCINCSDVKPKVGRVVVLGEGDYTVTELEVVEQDTARKLQEMENTSRGVKNVPLEILNFDEEELTDNEKALVSATEKALDDELEEDILGEDLSSIQELEEVVDTEEEEEDLEY